MRKRNPFERRGDHNAKLALLRRADTERDSRGFSLTGERKTSSLATKDMVVTLPRVKFLEKPDDDSH
jgi:hypothetical protein